MVRSARHCSITTAPISGFEERVAGLCPRQDLPSDPCPLRLAHCPPGALGPGEFGSGIAKAIGDRIAPVPAEILQRHLDARGRLPALVFGKMDHAVDPQNGVSIETSGDDISDRLFAFNESLKDWIKLLVWGERVRVLLILT